MGNHSKIARFVLISRCLHCLYCIQDVTYEDCTTITEKSCSYVTKENVWASIFYVHNLPHFVSFFRSMSHLLNVVIFPAPLAPLGWSRSARPSWWITAG